MSYHDVVNKAIELTVIQDEETAVSYLEPRYREVLRENDLYLPGHEQTGDFYDQELWEILKLEVEKQNAKHNVAHALAEWAYQILTQTIDPALVGEENELMQNIIEYMQLNQEVKEKKKELDEREAQVDMKAKAAQTAPIGMSFAKKDV